MSRTILHNGDTWDMQELVEFRRMDEPVYLKNDVQDLIDSHNKLRVKLDALQAFVKRVSESATEPNPWRGYIDEATVLLGDEEA